MTVRRALAALVFLTAVGALTTCRDATGPHGADLIDHVVVTGRTPLRIGETVAFGARAYDSRDSVMAGLRFAWTTTDTAVATVDSVGVVRTIAPGEVTVAATVGRASGVLRLTVTVRAVARIDVAPAIDSLFIGDSLQLTAALYDSVGATLTDRAVIWRSSDTSRAVVSAAGLVRARSAGGFAATGESEGQRGGAFLSIQLRAASLTLPDTVTLDRRNAVTIVPLIRSTSGVRLGGRLVTWVSGDTTVAKVSQAGEVTPVGMGRTHVVAGCCGGLSDSSAIEVRAVPLQWLHVNAIGPWVVGSAGYAYVELADSSHAATTLPVTWTTSDTSILHIAPDSADGTRAWVTPLEAAPAWLVVAAGGRRDSVRLSAALPVRRLAIQPDSVAVRPGATLGVFVGWQDSTGVTRGTSYFPGWTVADTSVAQVEYRNEVVGRRPGRTTATARDLYENAWYADTLVIVVQPGGSGRLVWPAVTRDRAAYTTAPDTIALWDSLGNVSAVGREAFLESSDTTVLTVSPARIPALAGRWPVTLRLRRPATAMVLARTDSLFATMSVVVFEDPVGQLVLTAPRIMQVGDSARLDVVARNAVGYARAYALTWSSSDSAVAVVTDSAVLVARGPGQASIEVRSGAVRDTATVVVRSLAGLAIDSVLPAVLLADGVGAIVGWGFDPEPAGNAVTVDGVQAVVTTASAGRLEIRLAPGLAYRCAPTHGAVVAVASGGAMAATIAAFSAARQLSLAVGDSVRVSGPEGIRCNELAPSGTQYAITVANQNASAEATTAYQLRGTTAQSLTAGPEPGAPAAREGDGPGAGGALTVELPESWRDRALHRRILEESRRLAARAGPPAPLLGARPRIQASVADSVGALVRFRIPQVDRPGFCSNYWGVTARRAFHGQHVDIFEDIASALAGQMDSAFVRLGAEFDSTMYPILLANFGDPLVLDSLLDRSGRLTLLVSPRVRDYATSFVASCDFYPESVAPSSNTGETIYVFAPGESTGGVFSGSLAYWQWIVRSVLMHESEHVASFAQRLARGAPLEESWLEEGSAVIAEELWSRTIYHTTWRGHAPYGATLYCDVRPQVPYCAGRPYAMFNAFALLYDYSQPSSTGNEIHTPLGPTAPTDGSFYGSAWSLLRWSIDQYASDEPSFIRALVEDPARTGVANLEARTGRTFSALVADWLLASLNESRVLAEPLASPLFTHPSWIFSDIFAGMATDFSQDFGAHPFGARATSGGTFTIEVPVLRGGTASAFTIAGQQVNQLLEIRGPGGGPPPSGLELRILRSR